MRGPAAVDDELAAAAIESVDDALMLVDDRPVAVAQVWVQVLRSAAGEVDGGLLLVHPTWWPRRRVEVVLGAARELCPAVVAVARSAVLADGAASVVEIGPEHVVIAARTTSTVVRTRERAVIAAVVDAVAESGPVLVDAPTRIDGATALAEAIVGALRARGTTASVCGPLTVGRAAARLPSPLAPAVPEPTRRGSFPLTRPLPVLAGAVVTTLVAAAAALTPAADPSQQESAVLLTEGHVALLVPAGWAVERITVGSGSARLRIAAPTEPGVALHLTQSVLPGPHTLDQVAAALRAALGGERAEVFTDFRPADQRAGRPAVTYREHRAGHRTDWIVLVDKAVRIAIGCQGPPAGSALLQSACEGAVRSAHAVASEKAAPEGTG
ncbi:type VII secretion-associated protein [Mycobacterium sp. PS03-16]|nr:type VII secretion-associated protein [Mycobacterium sp. PS03-16]